jgi:hypothetical protein
MNALFPNQPHMTPYIYESDRPGFADARSNISVTTQYNKKICNCVIQFCNGLCCAGILALTPPITNLIAFI